MVSPAADPIVEPLAGYTVGITAARRRDEFGAALERRGARVAYGPAVRLLPLADDRELRAATEECLRRPPDLVVVTTGIGFRGWIEAADAWGRSDELIGRLGEAVLLSRGPKSTGAIRAAGLREAWSPASESTSEVLDHLLTEYDLEDKRIAVQLHGEPLPDLVQALRMAGARIIEVPVYRMVFPEDRGPLHRVVEAVAAGTLDAVAFTSAPAVVSFLRSADELDRGDRVRQALRTDVVAACVGPVTAAPLLREDIPLIRPGRARLGALVREIVEQVPLRRGQVLPVAGHRLELRGHAAVLDDRLIPLGASAMAILRRLARPPGQVVSRADLLRLTPGEAADEHAVEVAVGRLRTAFGDARVVRTVVKRGYRLAYEPERQTDIDQWRY